MAKISQIKTDMDKVEKGQWFDYAMGIQFRVASINSAEYKKARDRILKPHQRTSRRGLSNENVIELIKPAVAKHLLLEWKNIEDDKGKPIPYSSEQALAFFNDPSLQDMYMFILETAGEVGNYLQEEQEESVKN